MKTDFESLKRQLTGDFFEDKTWRLLYATDASVFREVPSGVCRPAGPEDMKKIISFCNENHIPLIPRAAGTSLAGQVVGKGLVVDFSRYMNKILELNTEERWVRVQPGVILDDLNRYLAPHGLFFGPETSTSNRCMIGGMVANNACGSHSLIYGSTRDHTLEIKAILTDGTTVHFGPTDKETFQDKCKGDRLENKIYRQLYEMLSEPQNQKEIKTHFPDPRINRRNTGYAIDLLLHADVFGGDEPFNFCKLLCGAEGTLALYEEIKLNLVPLPPAEKALVCVHLNDLDETLQANIIALKYKPAAVELIDGHILKCTENNISQSQNRFFIKGDPGAILVVEFTGASGEEIRQRAGDMEAQLREKNLGYHFPLITGDDINKVWALRKAGLGVLSNMPGDAKPVAVIEDTAVHVEALPDFITEVRQLLDQLNLRRVFFAHIGSGELHMRPVLNLKDSHDVERFEKVAKGTARLVKKYRGSLSGEHGDGRLRAPFLPAFLGQKNVDMLKQVKATWDPMNIMNPGKITDARSIKTALRYEPDVAEKMCNTYFDFSHTRGFLRAVEQCNGSGDCRKSPESGGVMCPSYHATLNETDSTRGRANLLREMITHSDKKNPFNHPELLQVLDLCLSCKGCKAECPSSVDMGKYKGETLQQYYDTNGTPFRASVIGAYARLNRLGSLFPPVYNFFARNSITASLIKTTLGFTKNRDLPLLQKQSLRRWARTNLPELNDGKDPDHTVILFCDEFTNYNDTQTGINTILLLHRLGYRIEMPKHSESGRACFSKGLLKKAAKIANTNVRSLSSHINGNRPLIGIEPSAILTFRDEYPDIVSDELQEQAQKLAKNSFTVEEFLSAAHADNRIDTTVFNGGHQKIYLHSHCYQKALSSTDHAVQMLSMLENASVEKIECGCCGMAGAFGYEKNHYEISMQIGELSLFPAIRKAEKEALIVASGTSCRQQILDGTGRKAMHPADVLFHSLKAR
ncbi:MAG: FAD-linked oxidase C-terminal domain-containing protein [Bacteroidales bacterium]